MITNHMKKKGILNIVCVCIIKKHHIHLTDETLTIIFPLSHLQQECVSSTNGAGNTGYPHVKIKTVPLPYIACKK